MTKLERAKQEVFANQAGSRQITEFGTAKAEDPVYTKDVSQIQNSNFLYGWNSALLPDKAPWMEDMNALFYAITRQLAYLYQEGVPEYDPNTEYSQNALARGIGSATIYYSKIPENTGNSLNDNNYWGVLLDSSLTTDLKSYIDTQIQNIQTEIQEQVPDYSQGITVPFPTTGSRFTAPQNGIYVTSIFRNQSSTQLYINGILTAYKHTDRADGASFGDFTIPLSKGDVIWWDNPVSTVNTSAFYPYKNAQ